VIRCRTPCGAFFSSRRRFLATCPVDAVAEWRFLHTEHFHLIGDVSARQLRDVALRFEQFRDIAARLNLAPDKPAGGCSTHDSRVPEREIVRALSLPRDSGRILDTAGMFVDGPDTVYIAIRLDRGESIVQISVHEYAHLLMKSVFPGAPPWFKREEWREFYSTLRITRGPFRVDRVSG
jgi:hypothetical protein